MALACALVFGLSPVWAQFVPPRSGVVSLRATYGERGAEITAGLIWRIYALKGNELELAATSEQAKPGLVLPAGAYSVHVSYGLASAIRAVNVGEVGSSLSVPINAGALVVSGFLGGPERPIPANRQALSLFIPTANNSESRLVSTALQARTRLVLPEGLYHLVSTYSGSNSIVRSDIKVETGKVTEASINHRAANLTLKLVRQAGGVALADTEWTVETPGGDVVASAVGAFPSVDIAEGSYNVLARHQDREYRAEMKVEAGVSRDFELVMQ